MKSLNTKPSKVWDKWLHQVTFRLSTFLGYFFFLTPEEYASVTFGMIRSMPVTCRYRGAKFWKDETEDMCCSGGNVRLPPLMETPDTLYTFLTGKSTDDKNFLYHIRRYNVCFQMTFLVPWKKLEKLRLCQSLKFKIGYLCTSQVWL